MLVVSRRNAESVIVDGFNTPERALKVTVLEVKDGKVRLGFEMNKDGPAKGPDVTRGLAFEVTPPTIRPKADELPANRKMWIGESMKATLFLESRAERASILQKSRDSGIVK